MKKYLQYGLLATAIGASSCAYNTTGGVKRDFPNPGSIPRPADPADFPAWHAHFAENLHRILDPEFDKVDITIRNAKVIVNDKIELKKHTVARGYEKDGYHYNVIFGVDLDQMCDEYVRGRTLFDRLVGKDLYILPNDGSVIHSRLSKDAAEALDLLFNRYIKANNLDICQEWKEWNQKNFGPLN